MSDVSRHAPGSFCWVELATTDPARAKAFYTGLLGVATEDTAAGPSMIYTLLKRRGQDVGALYEMDKAQREAKVPPYWLSYVAVADADAATAKVKELGGTVMKEPFDVMEHGRMSVAQDPTGAVFALWQAKRHAGTRVVNEPGAPCWNELATRDTGKAGRFYSALFGWRIKQHAGAQPYTEFYNGDRPAAGMLPLSAEWGGVPPHWMVYFAVADCDAAAAQVKELGGTVVVPPSDISGVGRFSVVRDPAGAAFAVIKLEGPEE